MPDSYTLNGAINYPIVSMPPYRLNYMPIAKVMGTYTHTLNYTWMFLLKSSGAGYQSTLDNVVLSHEMVFTSSSTKKMTVVPCWRQGFVYFLCRYLRDRPISTEQFGYAILSPTPS